MNKRALISAMLAGSICIGMVGSLTACKGNQKQTETPDLTGELQGTEIEELDPGEVSVDFTPSNGGDLQATYAPYLEYVENIRVKCEGDIAALPCSEEMRKQVEAKPEVILDFMRDNDVFVYTRSQNDNKTFLRLAYTKNGQPYSELFTFVGSEHEMKCENIDELIAFLSGGYYSA